MANPSDAQISVSRSRLCQLAAVDRGKHHRWLQHGLLPTKRRYGARDIQQAALLDELNNRLKAKSARSVWERIRPSLGVPGTRLEVVIRLATLKATLVRSDQELADAIPRGEEVIVFDLSARAQAVEARIREFAGSDATRRPEPAGEAKSDVASHGRWSKGSIG